MNQTPNKVNPMVPPGATDPLERVQGKNRPGNVNDTKEYNPPNNPEETDVGEPGELLGSNAEHRHVTTGLRRDSELVDVLHGMAHNEEPK